MPVPVRRAARAAAVVAALGVAAAGQEPPAEPAPLRPGDPVDYAALAFRPEVWKERGQDTRMLPWRGEHVVFLTLPRDDLDGVLMRLFVERLDAGWQVYRELTGTDPRPFKILDDRAVIAAVPGPEFTCGAGCGYVGATGIELARFYAHDLPRLRRRPEAMPHYVFYEMGRNHFTFGDRHSCFTTGFAVFMRYVCTDALGVADEDLRTRQVIESVEERIAAAELPFLRTFTNAAGLGEKAPRVVDAAGRPIHPSDQPVTYASAMLRLRRTCGGDAWLRRFFAALRTCPAAPHDTEEGALQQALGWYVAASVAARRDLRDDFVGRWQLPRTPAQDAVLAEIDWSDDGLDAGAVVRRLTGAPEPTGAGR